MRFHMGLSFSWRTIKKFLIPIILGLLAFFGFNFLYENKPIDLGYLTKVYALENEEYEDINENDIPDEVEQNYEYWSYVLGDSNEEIEHKPLHDKVYWFDDNTTELGVLSSIYILLFLYCLTMVTLKLLTYVKSLRW